MWGDKQAQPNVPGHAPASPTENVSPTAARTAAWLGPSVTVKGEISGNEDLHIEGKVEGPVTLGDHRLTIGRSAEVTAQLVAREIVVYGKVRGDLRARDRIEIKKDGSIVGDLATARIVIEDGAYFKGKIEIDRATAPAGAAPSTRLAPLTAKSEREPVRSQPLAVRSSETVLD